MLTLGVRRIPISFAPQSSTSPWPQGWQEDKLSRAVLEGATAEFANAFNRAKAGQLRAQDLRAMADVGTVLFAHFDEIGLTAATQTSLHNNQDQIIGSTLSSDDIAKIRARLGERGIVVSEDDVSRVFSLTPADKQKAFSKLDELGLGGVQGEALNFLKLATTRLEQKGGTSSPSRYVPVQAATTCGAFLDVLDVVAIDALLFFGGCLLACLVCCGIAEALFTFTIVLELVYVVYCI